MSMHARAERRARLERARLEGMDDVPGPDVIRHETLPLHAKMTPGARRAVQPNGRVGGCVAAADCLPCSACVREEKLTFGFVCALHGVSMGGLNDA